MNLLVLLAISRLFYDYSPEYLANLEAALVRLHEAIITARNGVDEKIEDEDNDLSTCLKGRELS
ncbi:MAG: hypothetical protein CTY13_03870 [Methylobacter sp.]|nr:MAG: hypothetical protein CTY13_03870 [Methylobacter sp.]